MLEEPDAASEGRWLAWATAGNELCLAHLPAPQRKGRGGPIAALHSLSLLPGEHVTQVRCTWPLLPAGGMAQLARFVRVSTQSK